MRPAIRADRPGIALLVVMLLTMVIGAIAAGAALIGANAFLINEYDSQTSLLETVADAGLELGRARLNANPSLYSPTAASTLELDAAVYDAGGSAIPDVMRTVYSIPLGGGLGEYGNYAALVSIAEDADGARVIRRLDLLQESFAIYGYFTDYESDNIAFGNKDQLYGLVHSNSDIKIRSTGATFHGDVTTAGSFQGAEYATFLGDTTSQVTPILMPSADQLSLLKSRAEPAHLSFTADAGGDMGQSTLRIQFVSRDVDNDDVDEGFIRVYRSTDVGWVTANMQNSMGNTDNCGHWDGDGSFHRITNDPNGNHNDTWVLTHTDRACYLGGSDELWATVESPTGVFDPIDAFGAWDTYPGTVHADVSGEPDADYLFPIDRLLNSSYRGVIYVEGKVVVSGTVRGRLTIGASDNIIIGDDLVYNTDPGSGTCEDMLGLFTQGKVVVADNTINAPRELGSSGDYYTYDPDKGTSERIHASILALDEFTVQDAWDGSTDDEPCNGQAWGRGCLEVTGGIIQDTRGIVAYGNGTGNIKSYSHDTCAFTAPPPYFPSTGHFYSGRYYEVDPIGFDINAYFEAMN